MADMKLYSHEEMLDEVLGKKNTTLRNQYEEDMNSYVMGEGTKQQQPH